MVILYFIFTFPGTSERVCLITGNVDAICTVLSFIMEKIKEKPDPNAKPAIDFDNKMTAEREKQVILDCLFLYLYYLFICRQIQSILAQHELGFLLCCAQKNS